MAAGIGHSDHHWRVYSHPAGHSDRDDTDSRYPGQTGNVMVDEKEAMCVKKGLVLVFAFLVIGFAGTALAEINVSINIGPPVFVSEPPEVVYVPQMGFYFVPGGTYDVFFYNGFWWSRRGDHWWSARQYRGPWGVAGSVPGNLRGLRNDYRSVYGKTGKRINYGQWKNNNMRPINVGGQQKTQGGKNKGRGDKHGK
jgi:hypothetical protein